MVEYKRLTKRLVILTTGGILIVGTAYLTSLPPKPQPMEKRVSSGQFMNHFIEQTDNTFHDYLFAVRLAREIKFDEGLDKEFYPLYTPKKDGKIKEVSSELRDYIAQHKPAINIIREGVAENKCVVPEITSADDLLPYLAGFRQLGRVMAADARIKEIDGNRNDAYKEYLDVIKFAQDTSKRGVLINGLVSLAIDSIALRAMQPGLEDLDAPNLRMVIDGLKDADHSLFPLSEILRNESRVTLNTAEYAMRNRGNFVAICSYTNTNATWFGDSVDKAQQSIRNNARWLYVYSNKSRIKRNLEGYMEKIIRFIDSPFRGGEELQLEKQIPDDPISKILLPAYSRPKRSYAVTQAALRGTMLRAAAELYERNYNRQPDSLQDLVERGIIEEILTDPFSNQPFKYSDGKIYSIGSDLRDDKAKIPVKDWWSAMGDIIF